MLRLTLLALSESGHVHYYDVFIHGIAMCSNANLFFFVTCNYLLSSQSVYYSHIIYRCVVKNMHFQNLL